MPFANSANEKIYYKVIGNGEPLVFIMGLGLPHDEWHYQLEYFSKKYKVIAVDNRGVGRSSKEGEFSIEQFAKDINAVLEQEKIDFCSVVSVSMGVLIAQAFYHMYQHKVHSMVLAAPGVGQGAPFQVYPPAEILNIINNTTADSNYERAKKRLEIAYHSDFFNQPGCSIDELLLKRQGYNLNIDAYNKQLMAARNYNSAEMLKGISVPVLVLNSRDDQLSPFMASLFLRKRIKNSVLHSVSNAGHMFFVEKPEKFNHIIEQFLNIVAANNDISLLDNFKANVGIENHSSNTALQVAFLRAFAERVDDFGECGSDYLAKNMITENQQNFLQSINTQEQHDLISLNSFTNGVYGYLYARTKYIDSIFEKALLKKVPQVLILGAGYDTRAYRFNSLNTNTIIYEIDIESTQSEKIRTLNRSEIDIPKRVNYVSVNFMKDNLPKKLVESGFKEGLRTLVIWEGVTMYLDQNSFEKTIREIKDICGDGSEIFFDYFYEDMIRGNDSYYGACEARTAVDELGESYTFGIDSKQLEEYMNLFGCRIIEHLLPEEIESRYLQNAKHEKHKHSYGFSCFAHLQI